MKIPEMSLNLAEKMSEYSRSSVDWHRAVIVIRCASCQLISKL